MVICPPPLFEGGMVHRRGEGARPSLTVTPNAKVLRTRKSGRQRGFQTVIPAVVAP